MTVVIHHRTPIDRATASTLGVTRIRTLPFPAYIEDAVAALTSAYLVYDPSGRADIGQHMGVQVSDLVDGCCPWVVGTHRVRQSDRCTSIYSGT